jgi:hypothetical protein
MGQPVEDRSVGRDPGVQSIHERHVAPLRSERLRERCGNVALDLRPALTLTADRAVGFVVPDRATNAERPAALGTARRRWRARRTGIIRSHNGLLGMGIQPPD